MNRSPRFGEEQFKALMRNLASMSRLTYAPLPDFDGISVRTACVGQSQEDSSLSETARVDCLRNALDDLQQAEAEYRLMHDLHGDGAAATGRAWDLMRRAGNKARAVLDGAA